MGGEAADWLGHRGVSFVVRTSGTIARAAACADLPIFSVSSERV